MTSADKYIFNSMQIEEECYLLLCCFLASNKLNRICSKSENDHFKGIPIKEEQQIKKYLISIAIKLRMIDDLMRSHDKEHHIPVNDDVGRLRTSSRKKEKILSIREACNKIIHAKSLKFYYAKSTDKISYLKPLILFVGDKYNEDWKATINILKFVENAVYICNVYDETWDVSGY